MAKKLINLEQKIITWDWKPKEDANRQVTDRPMDKRVWGMNKDKKQRIDSIPGPFWLYHACVVFLFL